MRQLILGFVAFVVVMFMAGPALAGGWAVTTLDSVPPLVAGETVEIGFTIRQHGVTPVNPEGDVGIVFHSSAGGKRFFVAEPVGSVGHYVSEVTFPDAGTWSWSIRQGWFADQELGAIELAPRSEMSAAAGYRWSAWIRLGLPALALMLAAGAVGELIRNRPRPQVAAT